MPAFKAARRLSDDGSSSGEGLVLVDTPGRAEVLWRGTLGIRITADDAGLRFASPCRRPREIDAGAIRELRVELHRARHVLTVITSTGRVACGRPCRDRAPLERAREALGRAVRFAPHERFTAQPTMT